MSEETTSEINWYVLKVVSGQEKKIKTYIETEIKREKLDKNLKEILIPVEKVIQLRNGKKVVKERNYFPGYIMLNVILEGEMQHIIKSIPGVMNFLGNKGKDGQVIPQQMRQIEINRMLGKVDALNEEGGIVEVPFSTGESIKVIDGPFNGFTGVIEEINEERKKLKVIVKIFGRRTPLELNYMQVEKEQ
jgi:transcriptional antiterminator NusG